jgi:hypothetical protein
VQSKQFFVNQKALVFELKQGGHICFLGLAKKEHYFLPVGCFFFFH